MDHHSPDDGECHISFGILVFLIQVNLLQHKVLKQDAFYFEGPLYVLPSEVKEFQNFIQRYYNNSNIVNI